MPQGPGLYYLSSDSPGAARRRLRGGAGRRARRPRWAAGGDGRPARPRDPVAAALRQGRHDGAVRGHRPDEQRACSATTRRRCSWPTMPTGWARSTRSPSPIRKPKHTIIRERGYTPSFAGGGRGGRGGFGGRGGRGDDSASFYHNPGAMMTERGSRGGEVAMVSTDGKSVYLTGTQYHPDYLANPPQAFVDRYAIAGGAEDAAVRGRGQRLGGGGGAAGRRLRPRHRDPRDAHRGGAVVSLGAELGAAHAAHGEQGLLAQFTAAIRKRITVTRPDGFQFVVNLTLPADYKEGTRLPAMFWFYPYEYTSQAGVRPHAAHREREPLSERRPADHRVSDHAGIRGGQLRSADRGRRRAHERQLRARPA